MYSGEQNLEAKARDLREENKHNREQKKDKYGKRQKKTFWMNFLRKIVRFVLYRIQCQKAKTSSRYLPNSKHVCANLSNNAYSVVILCVRQEIK